MASLSGVSSSNVSSLYNSKNTISGLASGMDTEGMIEQLVQSYSTKITQLQQKNTKIEWKQEAYRSMISKLVNISSKYTSYTSDTNLMSAGFFSDAASMTASGENADLVSASGRATSDVVLNAVKQMATAARFQTQSNLDAGDGTTIEGEAVNLSDMLTTGTMTGGLTLTYGGTRVTLSLSASDWSEEDLAKLKSADVSDEAKAQTLANVLNKKLENEKIGEGSASEKIGITTDGKGNINFTAKDNAGNSVFISGASGNLKKKLGIDIPSDVNALNGQKSISLQGVSGSDFYEEQDRVNTISGKTFNINYNGTTKQITGPKVAKNSDGTYNIDGAKVKADDLASKYAEALNAKIEKQFGANSFKVTGEGGDSKFQLKIELSDKEHAAGSTLLINTDAGDALGIGKTASNYISTSSTLEKLMGDKLDSLKKTAILVDKDDVVEKSDGTFTDKKGNKVKATYDGNFALVDDEGEIKTGYKFELNGETIGYYDKDTKLSDIMADINNNKDANVSVNFSRTSNSFVFTSKDTGAASKVEFGDGLASAMFGQQKVDTAQKTADYLGIDHLANKKFSLTTDDNKKVEFDFQSDSGSLQQMLNKVKGHLGEGYSVTMGDNGALSITKDGKEVGYSVNEGDQIAGLLAKSSSTYTKGQDAIVNVSVNGQDMTLTRATNSVEIDGMTFTVKDEFGYDENGKIDPSQKVTFKSSVDSDKIVDAIKSFVNDVNEVMGEVRSAYTTMPYQKSDGTLASYDPLTEEDMDGMSESAIEKYEAKAKQGILFGDKNLSSLYTEMLNVFSLSGEDGAILKKMGISVNFSTTDGTSSIQLNEKTLRSYLETNLDDVQDLFTRSVDGGASSNGIMQNMKTQLDRYAAITGSAKGILVQEAGTPLYSLSLLDNNLQKQIDNNQTEIEKWQDKLSDRVDHYTSQFTRLELLINQMNSQSSMLSGMMGG